MTLKEQEWCLQLEGRLPQLLPGIYCIEKLHTNSLSDIFNSGKKSALAAQQPNSLNAKIVKTETIGGTERHKFPAFIPPLGVSLNQFKPADISV